MWIEILLFVAFLCLLLYRYVVKNFGRWEALGIPTISGTFPWGSNVEVFTQSKHFNVICEENYVKFRDEKVFGTYLLGKAVLNINDPELIRHIMVKDFNHFVDREDSTQKKVFEGGKIDEVWKRQMTSLSGEEWKDVRSTFTPIFTSGKMKGMVQFILEVGNELSKEVGTLADQGKDFELKSIFGKFSLDSIASCAFGINPKSFENESNVFVKNAARIFITTTKDSLLLMTRFIPGVTWIHKKLGINLFKAKETKFFVDVIRQALRHRRESGERRNDMIDLMIDCMKNPDNAASKENIEEDQYEKDMKLSHVRKSKEMFDEDTVVATAMVMLVAGYDTTGMTLSFLSYYLSNNLEVQEKLQEEIDQAFEDNDGKMPDYNTVQGLPYMDMCINETLRISSLVGSLFRAVDKPYTIPGTNISLKKDDLVQMSLSGIHYDERYYPNPRQFNPENFSNESKQSRTPYTFLPFGGGPRACIGMRFAMLEMKLALCELLHTYTFLPSDKNPEELVVEPTSDLGYIKGGLWAKVKRRNEE